VAVLLISLTFSIIITQFSITILNFMQKRNFFDLFKFFEQIDLKMEKFAMQTEEKKLWILIILLLKIIGLIYVFRASPMNIIILLQFFCFTDFYCFVVTSLMHRVDGTQYILRLNRKI
jgi:hypothetical protein